MGKLIDRIGHDRLLALILATAFIARVAVVIALPHTILSSLREGGDVAAVNVLAGRGFVHDSVRPGDILYAYVRPGYGFFLVALYTLFGRSPWSIGLAQALVGTLSVWLTYLIARRIHGREAGLVAAALVAAYPYLVYHDVHMNRTVLTVLFTLIAVWSGLRLAQKLETRTAVVLGFAVGGAALTDPAPLIAAPGLMIWLWWRHRFAIMPIIRVGVVTALAASAMVLPWTVRNYAVFSRLVPISTSGGLAFYKSHSAASYRVVTDLKMAVDNVSRFQTIPSWDREIDEVERDKRYYQEAWTFIRTHPAETAGQMAYNGLALWHVRITPVNSDSFNGVNRSPVLQWIREWSYTLWYTPMLVLGFVGFTRMVQNREPAAGLLATYFLAGTLVAMMFSGTTRYRVPLDPLLACAGAPVVLALLGRESSSSRVDRQTAEALT